MVYLKIIGTNKNKIIMGLPDLQACAKQLFKNITPESKIL